MPLGFTLSDRDLKRFQEIIDKARNCVDCEARMDDIEDAARKLLKETDSADMPDFVATRLQKLGIVIDMMMRNGA